MKKIILTSCLLIILISFAELKPVFSQNRSGYILLQVENNGEAWYVYPPDGKRYFLGRPADAFAIMKRLALGTKHDYIINTEVFPARLSGRILLDVEEHGEAYYIYPRDNKKYFLGRPTDAFRIMSNLGQGISDSGLANITIGQLGSSSATSSKKILQEVPFTSQAPFGEWSDLRQEDGCEEASSLMAIKWSKGETFTKEQALDYILKSSDYTQKKYGEYRDISLSNTLDWIIKDYFDYQKAVIKKDVSKKDIIDELQKGNIIIAPMNGQALHNPNYTQPGPPHHMLVIKGYDPDRKIFITNDPGTRKGESYEYDEDVFYKAIRDYETGFHKPDPNVIKDIIVISK